MNKKRALKNRKSEVDISFKNMTTVDGNNSLIDETEVFMIKILTAVTTARSPIFFTKRLTSLVTTTVFFFQVFEEKHGRGLIF